MAANEQWMPVGRIAGPFGVRGEMKVELLTDFPERFGSLRRLFIEDLDGAFGVENSRPHKSLMLLKLQGIDTPEAVNPLRGKELRVPRAEAAPLPPGHYFLSELVGLEVSTTEGVRLGPITDVLRTGANDVFVVGSGRDEVLVPAIQDAVRSIDLDAGTVVVEPWILETE